ncbi:methionyl-tRNA formyltransferase [Peptoniphilus sp. HMSC062D09]|uniref:methionyl-tRNA formyltransferase n=1 Tax=Peptoniphilus TaxID=162289 RepID=UPI0008A18FEB|nr:methionyl-tRNA formyltransferase [Peptoniphilus sp. HMSC062D09]OFK83440.1 methionyl-tRNA formyltransferase [Peptoniphilus sp. HMSC062D09]
MKFIFMGTPEFSVPILERLHKLGQVALVVSQEDKRKGRGKKFTKTPVKVKAEELGLEVYQPHDINSEESIEKLREVQADIIVVVAYGQILKREILDLPKKYIVNVHASLLPELRGAAPINRAIMEGKEKTGVSLMRVEEGLDSGAVSAVKEIDIKDMNAGELEDKLSLMGADILEEFIREVEEDRVNFTPQDEGKKTYADKILKDDLLLNFNERSKNLVNKIRGLSPHYGAKFSYEDKLYKIFAAEEIENSSDKKVGTIIKSDKELIIKTVDGAISVNEIQAPGKRAMGIDDFLRGNKFEENYVIGGK